MYPLVGSIGARTSDGAKSIGRSPQHFKCAYATLKNNICNIENNLLQHQHFDKKKITASNHSKGKISPQHRFMFRTT